MGASPARNAYDVVVPHHPAVGGLDHAGVQRGDEAAVGVVEVRGVVERQRGEVLAVGGLDDGGGRLLVHAADSAIKWRYAGAVGAKTSITPLFSRTSNFGSGAGAVGSWWVSVSPSSENDVEWHGQRSLLSGASSQSLQP